jgi:hypothetical protein
MKAQTLLFITVINILTVSSNAESFVVIAGYDSRQTAFNARSVQLSTEKG